MGNGTVLWNDSADHPPDDSEVGREEADYSRARTSTVDSLDDPSGRTAGSEIKRNEGASGFLVGENRGEIQRSDFLRHGAEKVSGRKGAEKVSGTVISSERNVENGS